MKRRVIFLYTFLGALFGLIFPLTSSIWLIVTGGYPLTISSFFIVQRNNPLEWMIDTAPFFLGLFALLAGIRQANVLALNTDLKNQILEKEQLSEQLHNLKDRLEHVVEKQVIELKAAAQVAREAAAIHDLDQLLVNTAQLISSRFGFYHTGIFLLDDAEEFAVLCAASSEGGKRMLARQHKLAVGKTGIVGYVAGMGKPRIALDVGTDAVFFNNPDLPETRSEMALPLKARDRIIGVLDVQSQQPNAFTEEDVSILQILADQLALAIDNARLFSETQANLKELAALNRRLVAQAWEPRLSRNSYAYEYDPLGTKVATEEKKPDIADPSRVLSAAILLRGQSLGEITFTREPDAPAWTSAEVELFHTIVAQLGLALENARMVEDSNFKAERERLLSDISSKLWASADIHTILRTAVEQIGNSLGVDQATIQLEVPTYQS